MFTAVELHKYFDTAVPSSFGFPEDSGGICLLANNNSFNRVAVALDVTLDSIEYAASVGAGALITHHPCIFGKIGDIRCDDAVGARLLKAANYGISRMAYHTRLDNLPGGVNDTLCSIVGIKDTFEFAPCARIGNIENSVTPDNFGALVGNALKSDRVKVFANNKQVSRVAVCSGSGGSVLKDAYLAGADTLLTGEVKYNNELDAAEYGVNLIVAGHNETERVVLPVIKDIILKGFPSAEVFVYYA
ncbi:MAG: Nif3-like dinuclear metal center hexameric protein [Clostridia bacterium]|nr:Nif3-like dinuclear metal center hexameric protein [Clostridia bacterium]